MKVKGKGKQGFASMTEDRRREIARMGGKAAHDRGVAHEYTSEEGRAASRKGWASRRNQLELPLDE